MNRLSIFIFCLLLSASVCFAMTGAELAQAVYDREDGDDAYFKVEMILIDKNDNRRERLLESFTREEAGLLKSYMEFLQPADIEKTRFLSWENQTEDDTQYLFLPALGRSRRIVSSQKKLSFVNTDFSYEDMQRRKPTEDDHRLLGMTTCHDRRACYVLESLPHEGTSQYGKRYSLIEQESLIPVAVDFYDEKGKKIKEFRVHEFKVMDGIWTTIKIEMRDLKTRHRTVMETREVKYNQVLGEDIFSLRYLER
ncbi:MAG TPA: outer membrane lipoprotein-sorting protein [Candidatus Bathyarchaeia archaeon]|nr:outer membrane lipoprotein-sorting protein [Candidatus Bathyarchaeia archaeon]